MHNLANYVCGNFLLHLKSSKSSIAKPTLELKSENGQEQALFCNAQYMI